MSASPSNVQSRWNYSITSSAFPSNGVGTTMRTAFAAFIFVTSSTLVDCCPGKSAGLSPFAF
jgi:hypothetical protein